jgi:hypothetical protein
LLSTLTTDATSYESTSSLNVPANIKVVIAPITNIVLTIFVLINSSKKVSVNFKYPIVTIFTNIQKNIYSVENILTFESFINEAYNKPRAGGKKRWSVKYKKKINCSNPKGFSQKQFCKRKRKGGAYKSS